MESFKSELKMPKLTIKNDSYNHGVSAEVIATKKNWAFLKADPINYNYKHSEVVNNFIQLCSREKSKEFISWEVLFYLRGPDARYSPSIAKVNLYEFYHLTMALRKAIEKMKDLYSCEIDGKYSFEVKSTIYNPSFEVISENKNIALRFWVQSDGKYKYSREYNLSQAKDILDNFENAFDIGEDLVIKLESFSGFKNKKLEEEYYFQLKDKKNILIIALFSIFFMSIFIFSGPDVTDKIRRIRTASDASDRVKLIDDFKALETLNKDNVEKCYDFSCTGKPVWVSVTGLRVASTKFNNRDIKTNVLRSSFADFELLNIDIDLDNQSVSVDIFGRIIHLDQWLLKDSEFEIIGEFVESNLYYDDIRGLVVGIKTDNKIYDLEDIVSLSR